MNKRGQAALEYLMTYGWALIVIAIVVGVLVFIVAAPTGNVVCSSSDPTKINVQTNNIDVDTGKGTFVFTNTSGGEMTNLTITEGQLYSGTTPGTDWKIDGGGWTQGTSDLGVGNHTVEIINVTSTTGTYYSGTFGFDYTDQAGLKQGNTTSPAVTITCQAFSVAV